MNDFYKVLDDIFSDKGAVSEIRAVARNLWFYDFNGYPFRVWDGVGKLVTTDGNEWLGSVAPNGQNVHVTPRLRDGRDGSSITSEMSLSVPNEGFFRSLKGDADLAKGRDITVYRAIFDADGGLRPSTPIMFTKKMTIISVKFAENIDLNKDNELTRNFKVTVVAKDLNRGRDNKPNRTYSDSIQKQIGESYSLSPDRGCEYVALLANRTYVVR